mgnify:CR=1 FL=1
MERARNASPKQRGGCESSVVEGGARASLGPIAYWGPELRPKFDERRWPKVSPARGATQFARLAGWQAGGDSLAATGIRAVRDCATLGSASVGAFVS